MDRATCMDALGAIFACSEMLGADGFRVVAIEVVRCDIWTWFLCFIFVCDSHRGGI